MTSIDKKLTQLKIIPVVTINKIDDVVPLGHTLIENGIPSAEITFRTHCAAQAIRLLRDTYPDMLIGAGTVLTTDQVDEAVEAGVDFIVSPGFNPKTVQYCLDKHVPIIPGVNNPSLVEQAMDMGVKTLKFFPAEPSGGLAMLKALSAVYPVKFLPTGGIDINNVDDYLAIHSVVACGGTWLVPEQLIDRGRWQEIGQLVKQASLITF
ncbi:bifunctional 4-hydroxy-2-oxoglutarate aldolase/2-dehydro-3-deoxy-phosphogluconate aldolase [Vibrio pectenicida]|uniref:2-dehydro-3-deoxy-phosphogluconate aldolase n=1 Tax=Vibrio pectenicida TaxID=62763 RepID=A0A427U1C0_9VIBR|nr:bifunctional 4-hydroxy-2-oxoglutarate aldolase/2-dehydro-3-deoxy-phosphogluconate aldolase [Vibrio pectenicida]RSD30450.1 bifunctional 4-hydroxy-2-oxoglutarate aldolase/2-dehydro-3-deoxy-phosphogluconate aldolase [Vibrio pectenicida]